MSILDEFARRFDEAQRPVHEIFQREPAPRGFNPRVIVARIVLDTESADEAEAIVEQLQALVRLWPEVVSAGWAVTTRTGLEGR